MTPPIRRAPPFPHSTSRHTNQALSNSQSFPAPAKAIRRFHPLYFVSRYTWAISVTRAYLPKHTNQALRSAIGIVRGGHGAFRAIVCDAS